MTRLPPEDRNLLLALVAGQGLLLWGSGRDTPLLVRLARIGELPTPAPSPSELGLAQLVEGLARLDGRPDLLLDRAQARRLVPVLPLFQQALASAGPEPASPTVDHFGSRLREYLGRTLRPSQVAHLQGLAARGELASTPAAAVERLPLLD